MFFKHTEPLVYVTKTGDCYHSLGCGYLRSIIPIGLEQAKKAGYWACSACDGEPTGTIEVNNYPLAFGILVLIAIVIFLIYIFTTNKSELSQTTSSKDYNNTNYSVNTTHSQQKTNLVEIGDTITIVYLEENETYSFVLSDAPNIKQERVDTKSPVGNAIINRKINDIIDIKTPKGTTSIQILNIKKGNKTTND